MSTKPIEQLVFPPTTQRGWYGVDLDATLAEYHTGDGVDSIGEPIKFMVTQVRHWLSLGFEVRIMTARVAMTHEVNADGIEDSLDFADKQRQMIGDWTEKHIGKRLCVTAQKDFAMIELWDDRAVRIKPNRGIPCCGDILK